MVDILREPIVKLVHATPQALIPHTSRACYQSFDKQDEASDERLLAHFVKNDESPLEFAWACVDITCSYAAHVHLLRHRFFSFQWRSQRYDDKMQFVVPSEHDNSYLPLFESLERNYGELRMLGAKKQEARYIMPQAITVQGFMAGNARAWSNFLNLRTANKVMPETRQVALQIKDLLQKEWPGVIQ